MATSEKTTKTEVEQDPTAEIVKRPRGRPRKNPVDITPKVKRPRGRPRKDSNEKILPNTNLEDTEGSINTTNLDLPEIEANDTEVITTFRQQNWSSDDWSGGLDRFSIGIDSMY